MENMNFNIPKKLKHYDFTKIIVESIVDDYYAWIEECRVKEIHSEFLIKYGLNNHINWYF